MTAPRLRPAFPDPREILKSWLIGSISGAGPGYLFLGVHSLLEGFVLTERKIYLIGSNENLRKGTILNEVAVTT